MFFLSQFLDPWKKIIEFIVIFFIKYLKLRPSQNIFRRGDLHKLQYTWANGMGVH
jgi:hypothetical protein